MFFNVFKINILLRKMSMHLSKKFENAGKHNNEIKMNHNDIIPVFLSIFVYFIYVYTFLSQKWKKTKYI